MTKPLVSLGIYSAVIVLITWAGASIPLLTNWRRSTVRLFISFGAGILLGVAFLHMIPEAAGVLKAGVGIPLLFGFLLLYVVEKFVMVHSCEADECEFHTVGWSAFVGLSLHSMSTGFALGSGLLAPELGAVVFLAIILHKFPEAFSLASLLLHENFSRRRTIAIVVLFSAIIPASALLTLVLFESVSERIIGWLIAFAAGTFLHVAADDLLPEVHSAHLQRKTSMVVFLSGILVMWFSQQLSG